MLESGLELVGSELVSRTQGDFLLVKEYFSLVFAVEGDVGVDVGLLGFRIRGPSRPVGNGSLCRFGWSVPLCVSEVVLVGIIDVHSPVVLLDCELPCSFPVTGLIHGIFAA